jgi:hypothetical protein
MIASLKFDDDHFSPSTQSVADTPISARRFLMTRLKVYKVKVYDVTTDQFVISRRLATREGAAIMRGVVLEDTGVVIDASQLEPGEQWTPKDFTPQS